MIKKMLKAPVFYAIVGLGKTLSDSACSVAILQEKFKSEGDVVRVSLDDCSEYYYGYYDKSP